MEKLTEKKMYGIIKAALADNADVVAFCDKKIASLDKKAAKAKERAALKKADSDALTDAVYAALSDDEFEAIATIVNRVEGDDVTTAKVTYRLSALVKQGLAEKSELVIEGTDGTKTRKIMAYRKVVND